MHQHTTTMIQAGKHSQHLETAQATPNLVPTRAAVGEEKKKERLTESQ